ncbi:hypothetical protein H4S08_003805 [Coemansia sp. RSA 1365]|nr:hypothetical protein H4S08_003805 [Coemansia sp. RSA 1365]
MGLETTNAPLLVWNNDIILAQVIGYLHSSTDSLYSVSLTSKRGWCYAIPVLWEKPLLKRINKFRLLVDTAGHKLPINLGDYSYYGELLRTLNLTMLAARWDLVDYNSLSKLFQHSHKLKSLDINLCSNIRSSEFEQMFSSNIEMCKSLESFYLSETKFSVISMQRVLKMMPNIVELDLSFTMANDELLSTIPESCPKIRHLYLESCLDITSYGIEDVVNECVELNQLNLLGCPYFSDVENVESHGIDLEWDGAGFDEDDDGSSDFSDEFSDDDDFHGAELSGLILDDNGDIVRGPAVIHLGDDTDEDNYSSDEDSYSYDEDFVS